MNKLLLLLVISFLVYIPKSSFAEDLGNLNGNQYDPDSTSNPYGRYGSKYSPDSINNPYGKYGSPYSLYSVNNSYTTNAPKIYDSNGNYHGKLSANPYDPDSTSNPYGRYGSKYSPDSINNPYGAGNPYGNGIQVESNVQNAQPIIKPMFIQPLVTNTKVSQPVRPVTVQTGYDPLDDALKVEEIKNLQIKNAEARQQLQEMQEEQQKQENQEQQIPEEYQQSQQQTPISEYATLNEYFSLGSTKGEVVALQGEPDYLSDSMIVYEPSYIYLENGIVTGWNDPKHFLKVKIILNAKKAVTYFTAGSPINDVIALEGTPDYLYDQTICYGSSSIKLNNNRVAEWHQGDYKLHVSKIDETEFKNSPTPQIDIDNPTESLIALWNPEFPNPGWDAPLTGLIKIKILKNSHPPKIRYIKDFTENEIQRFIHKAHFGAFQTKRSFNPFSLVTFPAGRYLIEVDAAKGRICTFEFLGIKEK
jgi:hypothetical protein